MPKPKSSKGKPPVDDDGNIVSRARPVEEFPDVADVLPVLCERYREISDEMKALEDERKELSSQILPLIEVAGYDSIQGDTWTATRVHGSRSTIVPELLVQKGVPLDVIEASTRKSEFFYVQVRAR